MLQLRVQLFIANHVSRKGVVLPHDQSELMDVKCSLDGEGGGTEGGGGGGSGRRQTNCWAADAASAHSGACALGQRN